VGQCPEPLGRAEWLIEPRLKGSIAVPTRMPSGGEGDRALGWRSALRAGVMVTRTANPPGQKQYWKSTRRPPAAGCRSACTRSARRYPVTGSGWPSFYIEDMVGTAQSAQSPHQPRIEACRAIRTSVWCDRVGFAWLPSLAWRLDKSEGRLKQETPHLQRAAVEYIAEEVWLTTQRWRSLSRAEHVLDAIDWIGGTAAVCHRLPAIGTMMTPTRCCRCRSEQKRVLLLSTMR